MAENKGKSFIGEKLTGSSKKQDKIYVHYFPHSHTDLGWISTLQDYYFGVKVGGGKYWNSVRDIIESTIVELEKVDFRTFTFAETKFFQMWWDEQTPKRRDRVRDLVKSGQLELINGGWSAPDEACPTYDDLLNNWVMG